MKLKRALIGLVALVALTGCTPQEVSDWLKWNSADPASAQAYLSQPEVAAQMASADMASVTAEAVRLNPPAPAPTGWSQDSSNGQCVGFKGLLAQYNPGWSVDRMAGIMFRESRCSPQASNSCCSGLLQMHRMHIPVPECGVYSRNDLYNPEANICAAAQLFRSSGYGAWSTS
jgi:hypothetical protein